MAILTGETSGDFHPANLVFFHDMSCSFCAFAKDYTQMGEFTMADDDIVAAVNAHAHIRVIDWRYRILTAVWRRIPRCLWRHFRL